MKVEGKLNVLAKFAGNSAVPYNKCYGEQQFVCNNEFSGLTNKTTKFIITIIDMLVDRTYTLYGLYTGTDDVCLIEDTSSVWSCLNSCLNLLTPASVNVPLPTLCYGL